ncbi:MAG: putative phosphodiesterase [Saprospiraceae bacterium]|jgi:predicted phosphodiesterase
MLILLRLKTILILLLMYANVFAQDDISYTVYLIGDTGEPELESPDPVLQNLKSRLEQENENAAIVFLGDNIYHNGLPPESTVEEHKIAKQKLTVQLDAIKNFKGEIYYVPGNHDWNDAKVGGFDFIKRQEKYIESYLDRGDVMIPDEGCPGPETKKLGKNVLLIALDSQWWLHPEDDDRNTKCPNKNRTQIIDELRGILDEEDDKHIIIAMHHPIYSDGSHNGFYQFKDHVFPLTAFKKNLFIPLPGLGSLYPFFRSAFGAKQDIPHPLYQTYREDILEAIAPYRNVVLASGHEHNLQYFLKGENHFIKSGSGSKSSPLPQKTDAVFGSSNKGYARLDYLSSGEVRLGFYGIDEDGSEKEIYNSIIAEEPLKFSSDLEVYDLDISEKRISASSLYDSKKFHRSIFGQLYRDDWSTETTFPAINLSRVKDGLKPLKVGGGYSSKSIRLRDKNKKQFVLRSVEKGVRKVVPPGFEGTLVESIFQDQISASQPYAALMVPPLAAAADVYHTNPQLVYLPKQPVLGDFNDIYGDALYLFEERPSGNQEDSESFGNSRKIISYVDMIDKIQNNSKHHIHQEQVLRSRLLDIYLGDWDRHDDQWRWASFKEENHEGTGESHTYYEPIPRDRDQVFFKYKGFVPTIARLASPQLRKFQNFEEDIRNVPYLGFNARHFDRNFLNQMDRAQWSAMANEIKNSMSDEVIEASIARLPDEINEVRGAEYRRILRARRDKMPEFAEEYYDFLAKYVDVVGTDKRELFSAERLEDGSTHIQVNQLKKNGTLEEVLYDRVFIKGETKEIRLYGLRNDDQFKVSGNHKGGAIIRIIGGEGEDKIVDESKLSGAKKSTYIYDSIDGNDITIGKDSKDLRTSDYRDNLYNRKEFYYNASVGIPFIAFNPDDILKLSYSLDLKTYGFRKESYDMRHRLSFSYAIGRSTLGISYDLEKRGILGKTDFGLNTQLNLPSNVNNYFGLSNEQGFNIRDFEDFNYFRYNQAEFIIHPSLRWQTKRGVSRFSVGPYLQYVDLGDNSDRFISQDPIAGLSEEAFSSKKFVGLKVSYSLEKIDQPTFPTQGISFNINPSYNVNTDDSNETFTQIQGDLTLYNYLWIPKPFVLATKLQWGVNWGEDFSFFQANYAGRSTGLRSFRDNRFGGRSSFTISNDLRLPLFKKRNGSLPFSFGIMGSFDHGRVWAEGESSNQWHTSYGGGFWISPFDIMPISINYMTSKEEAGQLLISVGFGI